MFKTIERAADCEKRSVIRFLKTRNVLLSEIHHQICQVCGDNVMSEGMFRKWVRMFNERRKNVHNEARNGRKVNERVCDDRCFTISDLFLHFPHISRTLLYDTVNSHLGYWRPHSLRRVYKNLCPATISASIMEVNMLKIV